METSTRTKWMDKEVPTKSPSGTSEVSLLLQLACVKAPPWGAQNNCTIQLKNYMANCKVQLKNSITSSCPSEEKTKHSFRKKEKNPLQTFLKKTILQKVLFFFGLHLRYFII